MSAEWQPIETAPRDGTQVLACWVGNAGAFGVVWYEDGDWREYDYENVVREPTCWMPLPQPPPS